MQKSKEDIELDKAAEKYVREIMKIQYKKDAQKRRRTAQALEAFQMENIIATKKRYGLYR